MHGKLFFLALLIAVALATAPRASAISSDFKVVQKIRSHHARGGNSKLDTKPGNKLGGSSIQRAIPKDTKAFAPDDEQHREVDKDAISGRLDARARKFTGPKIRGLPGKIDKMPDFMSACEPHKDIFNQVAVETGLHASLLASLSFVNSGCTGKDLNPDVNAGKGMNVGLTQFPMALMMFCSDDRKGSIGAPWDPKQFNYLGGCPNSAHWDNVPALWSWRLTKDIANKWGSDLENVRLMAHHIRHSAKDYWESHVNQPTKAALYMLYGQWKWYYLNNLLDWDIGMYIYHPHVDSNVIEDLYRGVVYDMNGNKVGQWPV